jgi:diguanylate cyclase (GGDEF)-like protein/PAS domain S-box-containing protein
MTVTRKASRRRGLPLLVGAVLLASATGFAIASLRAHADDRRQTQVLLAELRGDVQAHTAAVWKVLAGDALAPPAQSVETLAGLIGGRFEDLALLDPAEPLLLGLMRSFGDYELAAVGVLSGPDEPATPDASVRSMRDASAALAALIGQADSSYRQAAEATSTAADIGTTTLLVSAAVLLVLLFRRAERARRTALLLTHEQRVLRYSEERFRALVQHSSDMVTVINLAGVIRYQSSSAEPLLGHRGIDLKGRSWASLLHPDDASRAVDLLEACAEQRPWPGPIEWRIQNAAGGWLALETTVTNLINEPSVQGIVLNSRDVGERQELQSRLAYQAFHDGLTGLPNRAQFLNALQAALRRGHRRGAAVAVLLLDLDQFKNVNDSLGHAAGDKLLVGVAARLRDSLRGEDMAARLAGDEFVVLIEDPDGAEAAARVAARIAASLRQPFAIMGKTVFTSASIGIVYRSETANPEELLRDADVAMYRAKAAGEHGFVLFEPAMHAAAVERLQDETDLRQAVADGDFTLAYQPILEIATGQAVGVEALLRWRHPRHGDISPSRFIPIAEETGLIHAIGWWVIETAATQLHDWRLRDPRLASLQMSVNLSARQLGDPELPDRLADLLTRLDLPPAAFVLEMTEGAFSLPDASGAAMLGTLRRMGVRIAIDDFGTGYSTLGRLRELPVDIIKIDQSFVAGLGQPADSAIVRSLVDLARALDLTSVAEGVETDAQLAILRELGCGAAQGYLLGRPSPAEVAVGMLLPAAGWSDGNGTMPRPAPAALVPGDLPAGG